ncbi:MAG: hypothetical protein Q9186_005771 [Xanthomendoza sp. 1 TL-2023]
MPSSSSNKANAAPTSTPMPSPKSNPDNSKKSQPSHISHHPHKNQPTSHPHSTTSSSSSSYHNMNNITKSSHPKEGPATTAYKLAQKKIPPREPTPQGSTASSQACESADVSESERGVLRRERKDVVHWGPGGEQGHGGY